MILCALGLGLCAALGCLSVRLLAPVLYGDARLRVVAVVAGIALGLGAGSWSLFFTALAFDGLSHPALLLELALLSLAVVLLARRAHSAAATAPAREAPPRPRAAAVLVAGLAGALAMAASLDALWILPVGAERPHGTWDAWAIWNTRARFFFRAQGEWTIAFRLPYGHPDYPLLSPLTVARFWAYLGSETTAVPRLVAGGSLCGVLVLVLAGLATLRGRVQALVAGLVLVGTSDLVLAGVAQDAELPLALFLALACFFLILSDRLPPGAGGACWCSRGRRREWRRGPRTKARCSCWPWPRGSASAARAPGRGAEPRPIWAPSWPARSRPQRCWSSSSSAGPPPTT